MTENRVGFQIEQAMQEFMCRQWPVTHGRRPAGRRHPSKRTEGGGQIGEAPDAEPVAGPDRRSGDDAEHDETRQFIADYTTVAVRMFRDSGYQLREWTRPD